MTQNNASGTRAAEAFKLALELNKQATKHVEDFPIVAKRLVEAAGAAEKAGNEALAGK
jgi:hypothetical protein